MEPHSSWQHLSSASQSRSSVQLAPVHTASGLTSTNGHLPSFSVGPDKQPSKIVIDQGVLCCFQSIALKKAHIPSLLLCKKIDSICLVLMIHWWQLTLSVIWERQPAGQENLFHSFWVPWLVGSELNMVCDLRKKDIVFTSHHNMGIFSFTALLYHWNKFYGVVLCSPKEVYFLVNRWN